MCAFLRPNKPDVLQQVLPIPCISEGTDIIVPRSSFCILYRGLLDSLSAPVIWSPDLHMSLSDVHIHCMVRFRLMPKQVHRASLVAACWRICVWLDGVIMQRVGKGSRQP